MRFVKLTKSTSGQIIYVNMDKVVIMICENGKAILYEAGDSESSWSVKESVEEIIKMLGEKC